MGSFDSFPVVLVCLALKSDRLSILLMHPSVQKYQTLEGDTLVQEKKNVTFCVKFWLTLAFFTAFCFGSALFFQYLIQIQLVNEVNDLRSEIKLLKNRIEDIEHIKV